LTNPGSNPGRRDGKPATNRLSYGAAISTHLVSSTDAFYANPLQVSALLLGHP
jgi:hypothetical protein